jgi:Bacteriophage translational regulator
MINITDLVEVTLNEQDDFLKVRETLTRIGVASKKDKTLYQSCHILHKQGRYYIVHFKELFALDGKPTDISDNDLSRRNAIANLLEDWGLVTLVNPKSTETPEPIFLSQVKILSHKEKHEWQLVPKYNIGNKAKND